MPFSKVEEEFKAYGQYINNIHIKDRVLNGGTVPLGTGIVDFPGFFKMVADIEYKGSFILQAAREDNEMKTAQKNIDFINKNIKR